MNYLLRRRKLGATSCTAIKTLSTTGIEVVRNDVTPLPKGDIVFRWGCTSTVDADVIVNPAKGIHQVADKRGFRLLLMQDGRGLCPETWTDPAQAKFPCIVRPSTHHQGRNLWLCKDQGELQNALALCGPSFYISEFIDKVAEFRVFVVSGKVIAVASKTPADPTAVAWNVAQGGKFENVRWDSWPIRAVDAAVESMLLTDLDFGGVDVMVDRDERPYILEINSAPSLTSPYRQQCMTKAFDYIVNNGKGRLENVGRRKRYGDFIHPSIIAPVGQKEAA